MARGKRGPDGIVRSGVGSSIAKSPSYKEAGGQRGASAKSGAKDLAKAPAKIQPVKRGVAAVPEEQPLPRRGKVQPVRRDGSSNGAPSYVGSDTSQPLGKIASPKIVRHDSFGSGSGDQDDAPRAKPRIIGRSAPRSRPAAVAVERHDVPDAPVQPRKPSPVPKARLRQLELAMMLITAGLKGVSRQKLMQLQYYRPSDHNDNSDGDYTSESKSKFDRRLQRDLRELASIGLKIGEPPSSIDTGESSKVYYVKPESLLTDLIDLDRDELLLLDVLLAEFGSAMLDAALGQALASAVVRLKSGQWGMGLPEDVRRAAIKRALAPRSVEADRLAVLQRAHRMRVPVTFSYRSQGSPRPTLRTVEPYAIVRRGRNTYVVGRDVATTVGDPVRNFRLSRIRGDVAIVGEVEAVTKAVQTNGVKVGAKVKPKSSSPMGAKNASMGKQSKGVRRFEIPEDFDLEQYFSSETLTPARHNRLEKVTIDFDASVGFIVANQFTHKHIVREGEDGSVTLHLRDAAPGELWEFLSEFVGHFRIRHAKGVTEAMYDRIANTLAVYDDGKGGR